MVLLKRIGMIIGFILAFTFISFLVYSCNTINNYDVDIMALVGRAYISSDMTIKLDFVSTDKAYCQYDDVSKEGSIKKIDNVIFFKYQEFDEESGKGIDKNFQFILISEREIYFESINNFLYLDTGYYE